MPTDSRFVLDMDNFGFFDNVPNSQVEFWGVYSWRSNIQGSFS